MNCQSTRQFDVGRLFLLWEICRISRAHNLPRLILYMIDFIMHILFRKSLKNIIFKLSAGRDATT
jgi:hypothetical protein